MNGVWQTTGILAGARHRDALLFLAGTLLLICPPIAQCAVLGLGQPSPVDDIAMAAPVVLAYSPGELIASVQFNVYYDTVQFTLIDVAPGEAAAMAGKDALFGAHQGYATVMIAGLNQEPLAEGVLAILYFTSANDRPMDLQAGIDAVVFSNPAGGMVPVDKPEPEKSDDSENLDATTPIDTQGQAPNASEDSSSPVSDLSPTDDASGFWNGYPGAYNTPATTDARASQDGAKGRWPGSGKSLPEGAEHPYAANPADSINGFAPSGAAGSTFSPAGGDLSRHVSERAMSARGKSNDAKHPSDPKQKGPIAQMARNDSPVPVAATYAPVRGRARSLLHSDGAGPLMDRPEQKGSAWVWIAASCFLGGIVWVIRARLFQKG